MTDTFLTDIKELVFQTVCEIYDNVFQIDDVKIDVNKTCSKLCKIYFDSYYYNYKIGGSKYNTDIIMKILDYKIIENADCLIKFMEHLCVEILSISELDTESIVLLSNQETDDRREILTESVGESVDIIFDNFDVYLIKYNKK